MKLIVTGLPSIYTTSIVKLLTLAGFDLLIESPTFYNIIDMDLRHDGLMFLPSSLTNASHPMIEDALYEDNVFVSIVQSPYEFFAERRDIDSHIAALIYMNYAVSVTKGRERASYNLEWARNCFNGIDSLASLFPDKRYFDTAMRSYRIRKFDLNLDAEALGVLQQAAEVLGYDL
jgi:hypothetical protein